MEINRRKFIRNSTYSLTGAGLLYILPSEVWSSSVAPSDKINVALIGCNNQGFGDLKYCLEFDDVNCVALCDVDSNVLNDKAAEIKKNCKQNPEIYKDFRKMLEQKDIDAVIIGTPDHWHCLNLLYACQAGKDVYVEKPMANTIAECNIMVKASDYYKRIVQVGQQQRSGYVFQETMKIINEGTIGKLRKVNIWANFVYGIGARPVEDSPVPKGVDYDMWLGPAPKRPFNKNRFHGTWRHFWEYGGGLMTDWGVHLIDMGLWAEDLVEAPDKVLTYAGNSSTMVMQRDTFDTMTVSFPKKDYVINWNMTAGIESGPYDRPYGIEFVGENATIVTDRKGFQVFPERTNYLRKNSVEPMQFIEGKESHKEHLRNFLDCVKSRKTPICPPETGRVAALHAHIPNISARTGESFLLWDDTVGAFKNSNKANELICPEYRAPWSLPNF